MTERPPEDVVRRLNEAWLAEDFETLSGCIADEAVLLPPGGAAAVVGREAILEGYRQYLEAATTHGFTVEALEVFPFGATAVVHLRFEVDYSVGEGRHRERGLEVYVLKEEGSSWLVVWRAQLPLPEDLDTFGGTSGSAEG